jgi:hypothetical protein
MNNFREGKTMKTLSFVLLLIASMAFVLMGCSDNSSPVVSPTNQAINTPTSNMSLAKGGAVVNSAAGNGHISDIYSGVPKFSFSFTANRYADGTSSGEVQFLDHAGSKFHGTVIDLKVDGNNAKLCWTFSRGLLVYSPEVIIQLEGMFGCTVVQDNGEGKKATGPDMMTGFVWTDGSDLPPPTTIADLKGMSPNAFITWVEQFTGGASPFMPCDQGNVQVK